MDDQRPTEKVTTVETNSTEKVPVAETNSNENTVTRNNASAKLTQIVWYVVSLILAVMLIRFILALLGANLENAFASFIYQLTDPLVAPFRGLLQIGQFHAGVVRLEVETLLAMVIYGLIGWAITGAIQLIEKR